MKIAVGDVYDIHLIINDLLRIYFSHMGVWQNIPHQPKNHHKDATQQRKHLAHYNNKSLSGSGVVHFLSLIV
jgi:hypothetical protein